MTHLAPEGGNEALTPGRSEEFNFENADGITLSGRLELPESKFQWLICNSIPTRFRL